MHSLKNVKRISPKSKVNLLYKKDKKKDSSYRRRLEKKLNLVLTNNAEFSQNLALNKQKLLEMLNLIFLYLMAFTLNIYGLLSKNKIFCIMDSVT